MTTKITNSKVLRKKVKWTVDIPNKSIENVFSMLSANEEIPFIRFMDIYKVKTDFVPLNRNWMSSYDIHLMETDIKNIRDEITARVKDEVNETIINKYRKKLNTMTSRLNSMVKSEEKNIYAKLNLIKSETDYQIIPEFVPKCSENNTGSYVDVIIKQDENDLVISVSLDDQSDKYKSISVIKSDLTRFLNKTTRNEKISIINETVYDIAEQFEIPISIDYNMLKDMISIDDDFIKYLSMDETLATTREYLTLGYHDYKKDESTGNITYGNQRRETLTFTLTTQLDASGQEFITRIKTKKTNTIEVLDKFKNVISNLLEKYNENEKKIIAEYAVFFKQSTEDEEDEDDEEEDEKYCVKVAENARSCTKNRQPCKLNEKDKKISEWKDSDNTNVKNKIIEYDGGYITCNIGRLSPVNLVERYACLKEFVGEGDLSEVKATELVAIMTDKKINAAAISAFKRTFGLLSEDEDKAISESKTGGGDYIYPGFVNASKKGQPPVPCCFQKRVTTKTSVKQPQKTEYTVKTGIASTGQQGDMPDSLSGILPVLEGDWSWKRLGVTDNTKSLISCIEITKDINVDVEEITRSILDTPFSLNLAKQECYDLCDYEINSMLVDPDMYLDPRRAISLIEEFMEVNLVVFSDDGVVIPYHKHSYYKHSNNHPLVLLYEQKGTAGSYPRLELMIRVRDKDGTIKKTVGGNEDAKITESLLASTTTQKYDFKADLICGYSIKSQGFDSIGKTRILTVQSTSDPSNVFKFQTSPMQPFKVEEDPDIFINPFSATQVKKFKEMFEKTIGEWDETDSTQLKFVTSNVTITIPLESSQIEHKRKSLLDDYVKKEKISRIIINTSLWAFANQESDVYDFIKSNLSVDKSQLSTRLKAKTTSGNPPYSKEFEKNYFVENGKILLGTEDLKKRVEYSIKITEKRTPEIIKNLKNEKYVTNYFTKVTDFIPQYYRSSGNEKYANCLEYNVYKGENILNPVLLKK